MTDRQAEQATQEQVRAGADHAHAPASQPAPALGAVSGRWWAYCAHCGSVISKADRPGAEWLTRQEWMQDHRRGARHD